MTIRRPSPTATSRRWTARTACRFPSSPTRCSSTSSRSRSPPHPSTASTPRRSCSSSATAGTTSSPTRSPARSCSRKPCELRSRRGAKRNVCIQHSLAAAALLPLPVGGALVEERGARFGGVLEALEAVRVVLLGAIRLAQREELDAVHRLLGEAHGDRALRGQGSSELRCCGEQLGSWDDGAHRAHAVELGGRHLLAREEHLARLVPADQQRQVRAGAEQTD